jgi:hypothetical protein
MNVIRFAADLYQFRFKAPADFSEDIPHRQEVVLLKHVFPVFSNKDQVDVKIENTMAACSDFG